MPVCILCKSNLSVDTKPEHILLDALGGRKTTKNALCSKCNNEMGNTCDKDLAESVQAIRTMANLRSGSSKKVPVMKGIEAEGVKFDLHPASVPILNVSQPMKIASDKKGNTSVSIQAKDEAQFLQLIEGCIKQLGLNAEDAESLKKHAFENATVESRPAPQVGIRMQMGAGRSVQAMAKACLVLLADTVGTDEVIGERYDNVRDFIINGVEKQNIVKLDTRPLPNLPLRFGTNPNIVWVGSDGNGNILGYYRLYGAVGWSCVLTHNSTLPSFTACLISNPYNQTDWACDASTSSFVEYEWVSDCWYIENPTPEASNESMQKIMQHAQAESRSNAISNAVDESLAFFNLKEEERLSKEWIWELSDRMARLMLKLPSTKPFKKKSDD